LTRNDYYNWAEQFAQGRIIKVEDNDTPGRPVEIPTHAAVSWV
jgi:hypothetical protein